MHQCVQLEFTEVSIIYVYIAIHFTQVHAKTIGVVIDQVHGKQGLVVAHCFHFEVPEVAVIE